MLQVQSVGSDEAQDAPQSAFDMSDDSKSVTEQEPRN
jgi:hypothetical protein